MNPILAASLVLALFLEPQDRSQRPQPQQNAASDTRGTPQVPLVVQMIPANGAKADAHAQPDDKNEHALNERVTAWSTFALAIITLVLAVGTAFLARYTLNLWQETKRLAKDAKDNAEIQARKMEASVQQAIRSANAMEAQVRKTDEIAQQELRAYLGPAKLELDKNVAATTIGRRKVTVYVKNFGLTPATDVRAILMRSIARPDGSNLPSLDERDTAGTSVSVVYPGDDRLKVVAWEWEHPPEFDQKLASGDVRVFLQCRIRYRDVFRKWNVVTSRWIMSEPEPNFEVCDSGNDAHYGLDTPA